MDVPAALGDNHIQGQGALAGAGVADDELALALADGHQGIEDLAARDQGPADEVAVDDGGRGCLQGPAAGRFHLAPAVQGPAQGVHHPSQVGIADAEGELASCQPGRSAGGEALALMEQDGADAP